MTPPLLSNTAGLLTKRDSHLSKDGIDMRRDMLRRARVLVVCGTAVDEDVKNDIAVAQRLNITATTLDGIVTVNQQGRNADDV